MKKKIIALLTAAVALAAMFPPAAWAATIDQHDIFFEGENEAYIDAENSTDNTYSTLPNDGCSEGKFERSYISSGTTQLAYKFDVPSAGMYELVLYGAPSAITYRNQSKVQYSVNGSAFVKLVSGNTDPAEDTALQTTYDAGTDYVKNTVKEYVELKEGQNTLILKADELCALNRVWFYVDGIGFNKISDIPQEPAYTLNLTHALSDAVVAADGTGTFRFITKFNLTGDAPQVEAFGTYIIPETVFEDDNMLADGAIVTYTEEASQIQDGDTYTADLIKIPSEYFGEKLYAMSYVKFAGEEDVHFFNIVINSDTAQCVNDFIE